MNIRRAALTLFVGSAVISCSEGSIAAPPTAPTAALVSLVTPNTDDGALVVTLRGPDISDIQAVSSAHVLYSRHDATGHEARVVVVGDINGGPLVRITLGGGHSLSEYSASIEQVAMRNDSLRVTTAGYQLSLTAAP